MENTSASEEFWSQGSQVDAFSVSTEALGYEVALIEGCVAAAGRTGPTAAVHVVGVGTGRELRAVRRLLPDARIRAWDISEPMVRACRRFIEREGLTEVSVARSDVANLTAEDGPADVVVLLNAVLCYVNTSADRERTMAALHAVVRPGGAIAIVVHQRNGRLDWTAWFALRSMLARIHVLDGSGGDRRIDHGDASMVFHHYTPREVDQLLSAAGFTQVRIRSLRSWARSERLRIPVRSPNPLMVLAVRPTASAGADARP